MYISAGYCLCHMMSLNSVIGLNIAKPDTLGICSLHDYIELSATTLSTCCSYKVESKKIGLYYIRITLHLRCVSKNRLKYTVLCTYYF